MTTYYTRPYINTVGAGNQWSSKDTFDSDQANTIQNMIRSSLDVNLPTTVGHANKILSNNEWQGTNHYTGSFIGLSASVFQFQGVVNITSTGSVQFDCPITFTSTAKLNLPTYANPTAIANIASPASGQVARVMYVLSSGHINTMLDYDSNDTYRINPNSMYNINSYTAGGVWRNQNYGLLPKIIGGDYSSMVYSQSTTSLSIQTSTVHAIVAGFSTYLANVSHFSQSGSYDIASASVIPKAYTAGYVFDIDFSGVFTGVFGGFSVPENVTNTTFVYYFFRVYNRSTGQIYPTVSTTTLEGATLGLLAVIPPDAARTNGSIVPAQHTHLHTKIQCPSTSMNVDDQFEVQLCVAQYYYPGLPGVYATFTPLNDSSAINTSGTYIPTTCTVSVTGY